MNLSQELALAQKLALKAGHMALSMQGSLSVSHKPLGQGPVSNADILIDKYISENLAASFPKDQIISEESYQGESFDSAQKRTWFIDPIDGTRSYIKGEQDFVIMIALVHQKQPILGIIYHPHTNTLWSGWQDQEGWHASKTSTEQDNSEHNQDLKPLVLELLNSAPRLMVSKTSSTKKTALLIQALAPKKLVHISSIGLKAMLVLDSEADLYVCWSKHIKLWDSCAPTAIALARGAIMCSIDGTSLEFGPQIFHNQAVLVASIKPDAKLWALLKNISNC